MGCLVIVALLTTAGRIRAQNPLQFSGIQLLTNRETLLRFTGSTGINYRIDVSSLFTNWEALTSFRSTGSNQYTDSTTPFLASRFYRAAEIPGTNVVVGDHLPTAAGDVVIRPVYHAGFVMSWDSKTIYSDPYQGAARFQGLPRADLILVTHDHGDHFEPTTLTAVRGSNVVIIAPQRVFQAMSTSLRSVTTVLTNGATTNLLGLQVEAVPAYNGNHPRGQGNGYVVTIGGKRIYMSGDTGDIAEMRALPDIDIAFVCMNSFTMSVSQAASAVREFRPKVVYPYHYSESDLNSFKRQVGNDVGVEVRIRRWY